MNPTINAIKEQVSAIVNYKSETFDALEIEFNEIKSRIEEGIDKMHQANERTTVFTEQEIKEVDDYAREILCERYRGTKNDIIGTTRANFQF